MAKDTYPNDIASHPSLENDVAIPPAQVDYQITLEPKKTERGRRHDWLQRTFPTGFKYEFKALLHLGWPAGLATFCTTCMGVVSLIFCGRLGREELDAVGIAISLLNITGVSIFFGLTTACDTLFSQAFGGNKKQLFGIFLQRSLMIIGLTTLLCWAIHLNTELILIIVGQNRTVAKLAGIYILYFMPGLFFQGITQVFIRYLQNQNKVLPTVVFGAIGNIVNAAAQYIAIYVIEAGLIGSALSQVLAHFTMLMSSIIYILATGIYKDNWYGWSVQSLEHWGQFLHLAVAGLVMTAIEWWSFEIGVFLNGIVGEVELGATAVLFQVEQLLYMVPYGIAVASSIRVGQSLGAGNARATMTTARVAMVLAMCSFLLVAVLLLSLRNVVPLIFTDDREIIELVSSIIPILVFLSFLDCILATSMGTLRGCGKQWLAAACNSLGYLVIAIPLAAVFLFVLNLGAPGFWWGLVSGISMSAILYIYILLCRINWDDEVVKTQMRLAEKSSVSEESRPLLVEETSLSNGVHREKPKYSGDTGDKSIPNVKTQTKTRLVLHRLISVFLVVVVFLAGLCIRLFVPLPQDDSMDSLSIQNTTQIVGIYSD